MSPEAGLGRRGPSRPRTSGSQVSGHGLRSEHSCILRSTHLFGQGTPHLEGMAPGTPGVRSPPALSSGIPCAWVLKRCPHPRGSSCDLPTRPPLSLKSGEECRQPCTLTGPLWTCSPPARSKHLSPLVHRVADPGSPPKGELAPKLQSGVQGDGGSSVLSDGCPVTGPAELHLGCAPLPRHCRFGDPGEKPSSPTGAML